MKNRSRFVLAFIFCFLKQTIRKLLVSDWIGCFGVLPGLAE